ncbi:MAG TPA: serine/threonine-protein kinase [Euzebyales bacterium]|nr:serine/threonine-protein kinase [Euzebyales bacterium]
MSPAAGRAFGPYRLLRSIATDAISTTYFATTDDSGSPSRAGTAQFAVRIAARFDDGSAHAAELVQQFLAAAQKAGAVDHPSIVRPRDLGVIDGHPYVATPFIRAVPLGDMVAHGGSINESAALAIFAQLAGGLDAAHRADVVHGALSPRTIWIGPSSGKGLAYVGYLVGFGSSLLLRERLAHEARGGPIDDLLYVAPEQLRGEPITPASDQYALACALYHTLVGAPPFERDSRSKLYGAHLMATPPPLGDIDPSAAASTSAALQRAMSKQPAERFATCGILINAALPARDAGAGAAVPVAAGPEGVDEDPDARGRGTPWPLVLAGLGMVVVGLVLWLLLNEGDASSATEDAPGEAAAVAAVTEAAAEATPTTATSATPVDPSRWSTEVSDAAVVELQAMGGMVLAIDDDGLVTNLRPAAGQVRWRAETGGTQGVAAGDGLVAHGGDQLTVLDRRTGEVRWRSQQAPTRSLHVADGAVVGAAGTATDSQVLAVGVGDGAERWHVHSRSELVDARLTVEVGSDLTYALQGGRLAAMDPATSAETAVGPRQISGPMWEVDVADTWPALAATRDGVALVTRDGEVCQHGATDGVVDWCAPVPGASSQRPRLFATSNGVVAATSRAVIAVDHEVGAPSWSVSPGSPENVVAVSRAAVVVADADGGIVGLDPVEGTELFSVADLGEVTALAAHGRWLVVGTADGRVRRIDIDAVVGG